MSSIVVPASAMRLCRMRSRVSRSTVTSWVEQQIEVLEHRAGQAVFNGNDGGIDRRHCVSAAKTSAESEKGNDLRFGVELHRRFVAEGAGFSLNCDFHSDAGLSRTAW